MGHSFNLMHTHETCCTYGDGCADTIPDNASWTKDQLSQNNFGATYANLTADQKAKVDLVYNNVMSYHVDEPQLRFSPCQMDRESAQGYTDRNWLLAKKPIYVRNTFSGSSDGSFTNPYTGLQDALNAGGLSNSVLVLQQGSYHMSQDNINADVELVTRSGASSVNHPGVQLWKLPVDLANSKTPEVGRTVKAAQDEDTSARNLAREAESKITKAATREEKAAIQADTEAGIKLHKTNARTMLEQAEK
jgi:hypothetical protein